jgi:hypothetical protein
VVQLYRQVASNVVSHSHGEGKKRSSAVQGNRNCEVVMLRNKDGPFQSHMNVDC